MHIIKSNYHDMGCALLIFIQLLSLGLLEYFSGNDDFHFPLFMIRVRVKK